MPTTGIKLSLNAEALNRHLESRGISKRKLAMILDIDYSHLYRLEIGQRNVGMKVYYSLQKYCERKGLNVKDYILEVSEDEN